MKDRRHYVRWQINRNVKVRLGSTVTDVTCVIYDLNFKGAKISLAQRLPLDRPLKINISLLEGFVFEVEIFVVWYKQVMDRNVYGVYFTRIKDSDKETIYKFMRRDYPGVLNKLWWQSSSEISEKEGGEEKMNQRIFERIPVNLLVKLIDLDRNKEIEANTFNVSAKGLGIVSTETLNPGDALEIWLKISDKREPFYTRGTVVWTKPQEPGGYKAGIFLEKVEFMGMSQVLW